MAEKPKYEQPTEYKSDYQGQIDNTLKNITNKEAFTYNPLKDASYQGLAKLYQRQGEQAAKNTMGDAAALNGGYGSSYAVTASQQARNDYNQQLASQIPALQEAAYNRYLNDYNMNLSAFNALQAADDSAYGRHRDTVADSQWKYGMDYQGYRDDVSDSQWQKSYDRGVYESDRNYEYQKSRDAVTDSQWAQEFALQKKAAASSGRGSSSRGGYGSVRSGRSGSDVDRLVAVATDAVGKGINALSSAVNSGALRSNKKPKKGLAVPIGTSPRALLR